MRINSNVPFDLGPHVTAIADFAVLPGSQVSIGLDRVATTNGSIVAYDWTQEGGISVLLSGTNTATLSFTAPSSDSEHEALVFKITVTDSAGETDADYVTVISSETIMQSSSYRLASAPGSFIGGGRTDIDEQYLSTSHRLNGAVVAYKPPDGSGWEAQFAAPFDDDLNIKQYHLAHRAAFRPRNFPGADFGIIGRGCNELLANFKVLDVGFTRNKFIERLAVNMDLACVGNSYDPIEFRLRLNSVVPIFSRAPIADPGPDQIAFPDDLVFLDADATQNDFGVIDSYLWRQLSGPSLTLSGSDTDVAQFVAPDVLQGQGLAEFELTVVNDAGFSDTESAIVNILGSNDLKIYVALKSLPGGILNRRLDENTGYLFVNRGLSRLSLNFIAMRHWDFYFSQVYSPGDDVPDLVPGLYEQAQKSVPGYPYMWIGGSGYGCSQELGSFVVHELSADAKGNLTSAALDFESHCDFRPPLLGKIRFNSTVPDDAPGLYASAGQEIDALPDQLVELSSEGSFIGPTAGVSYQWQQISGPPVTILNGNQSVATFVAPGVVGIAVFQVTVTNAEGEVDTAMVSINLVGPNAPLSGIYLQSTPGEPFLAGESLYVKSQAPLNQIFQSDRLTINNSSGTQLRLFLRTPDGTPLQPGDYTNAFGADAIREVTGLDFWPGQSRCDSAVGWFRVHEIVTTPDDTRVETLAVDFWQSCDYSDPPILGSVRMNSTIPFTTMAPVATAGPDYIARAGDDVTLTAEQSFSWSSSISAYSWRQVSGPPVAITGANTATPRLTLPPSSGQTEFLQFEVTVTNDFDLQSSATATITSLADGERMSEVKLSLFDPGTRQEFFTTYFGPNNAYIAYDDTTSSLRADVFNRQFDIRLSLDPGNDQLVFEPRIYHQFYQADQDIPDIRTNDFPFFRCDKTHEGWLHIRDVEFSGEVLTSIAYEIEQICDTGFGVRISSRLNSPIPFREGEAVVIQAPDQSITEGTTAQLYDVIAYIEGEVAQSVSWEYLRGPQPLLASFPGARTMFVAPVVNGDEVTDLRLTMRSRSQQTYAKDVRFTILENDVTGLPAGIISTPTATGTYGGAGWAIAVDSDRLIRLETRTPEIVTTNYEPDSAPYGALDLEFETVQPGQSIEAVIHLERSVSAGATWLQNTPISGWDAFRGQWTLAAGGKSIKLQVTDGGDGDLDGQVNNRVLIRGGIGVNKPVTPPPPPSTTSGGGGGSTGVWAMLILALVWLSRRRRSANALRSQPAGNI